MNDPRTTPANSRVAATHLAAAAPGLIRRRAEPCRIRRPVVDLLRTPYGPRERQVLWGETVDRYEDHQGYSFVQARKDGFVGYLPSDALGPERVATHWLRAPSSQIYEAENFKSRDLHSISFGTRLTALADSERFVETSEGFVPKVHLCPIEYRFSDPVSVAALFLGTPYLWGGNSRSGIDCSGLVQAALLACGLPCPGDSDQQQSVLGQDIDDISDTRPGDLVFWKGHVAMVADADRFIHANAHHMAVSHESVQAAIRRIRDQGDGPVTAHKRL